MTVDSAVKVGTGTSNEKSHIILLMLGSGLIIFIEHAKDGTPQDGTQYIAIGIVGFLLLIIAEFAPAFGFAFALLFFVAVLLNSPKGIPIIAENTSSSGSDAAGAIATANPPSAAAVANNGTVIQQGNGQIVANGYGY